MTERIERVVVPLDSASEIEVAIDTAAHLAARWKVPLHGIFIEDEEVLGLAGLPFASEVTLLSGSGKLSRHEVERHFRALAEKARRQLEASAARHQLGWSFAVTRGPLTPALLRPRDFVVLSAATRPIGAHFRVQARSWSAIAMSHHPLLLAGRRWERGGSVLTLLRRSGALSRRLMALAAEIADLGGREIRVISELPAEEGVESGREEALAGRTPALKIEAAPAHPSSLRERVLALDCRLLVVAAEAALTEDLRPFVEGAICDLLVIGEDEEEAPPRRQGKALPAS